VITAQENTRTILGVENAGMALEVVDDNTDEQDSSEGNVDVARDHNAVKINKCI
jgi:hypothetical protein